VQGIKKACTLRGILLIDVAPNVQYSSRILTVLAAGLHGQALEFLNKVDKICPELTFTLTRKMPL